MREEKLLTVREVASQLGLTEKEVTNLAENGDLPAYKVGGVYLRFKRNQVIEYGRLHHERLPKLNETVEYPLKDRVSDFFYFNDFYIFALILVITLLTLIFKG